MNILRTLTIVAGVLAGSLGVQAAPALAAGPVKAKNVVLVHGAWADGSSWAQVIPKLQAAGLHVTAVQNPLTSLADSVAETRRVLAQQDGPTVLVAHSWGGTVISEVGTDPKVTGLVYIAARAPDAGEDFVALSQKFPAGPARAGVQEHDGFTKLSEDAFLKYFANGVDPTTAKVLYAVQWPTAASIFAGRTTAAAWRSKPSWYAVSKLDQTINPDLERFLAKRMNATTVELEAGHLSLVSQPDEVADLILAAAGQRGIAALAAMKNAPARPGRFFVVSGCASAKARATCTVRVLTPAPAPSACPGSARSAGRASAGAEPVVTGRRCRGRLQPLPALARRRRLLDRCAAQVWRRAGWPSASAPCGSRHGPAVTAAGATACDMGRRREPAAAGQTGP